MTFKLPAHFEGDVIVLDAPAPPHLKHSRITVLIEENPEKARVQELAQSQSGFVRDILLNEEEEVWSHD